MSIVQWILANTWDRVQDCDDSRELFLNEINVTKKPSARSSRRIGSDQLNRNQIVGAALAIIDRQGLDGFSMREVARELGVFPTSIYWHFKAGKNELLAAVASLALDGVTPALHLDDDWREWLKLLFRRYRKALSRHPNVAPLLGAQLVSNGGVNPILVERVLTALHGAGFRDEALVDTYNAVVAAMLGYVTLEFAPVPRDEPDRWAGEFEQSLRQLPADHYPLIRANFARLSNRAFILRWESGNTAPLDSGFDAYVDAFVLGLEGRLAKSQAPGYGPYHT